MTSEETDRLTALMMDIAFETVGACSPSTVSAIDFEKLDRKLVGVASFCSLGLITREQALLWTRGYWAAYALMAIAANRGRS